MKRRHKQLANLPAKYTANCLRWRSRNKDKKNTGILQPVQTKSKATTVRVTVTAGDTEGLPRQCPLCFPSHRRHRRHRSHPGHRHYHSPNLTTHQLLLHFDIVNPSASLASFVQEHSQIFGVFCPSTYTTIISPLLKIHRIATRTSGTYTNVSLLKILHLRACHPNHRSHLSRRSITIEAIDANEAIAAIAAPPFDFFRSTPSICCLPAQFRQSSGNPSGRSSLIFSRTILHHEIVLQQFCPPVRNFWTHLLLFVWSSFAKIRLQEFSNCLGSLGSEPPKFLYHSAPPLHRSHRRHRRHRSH